MGNSANKDLCLDYLKKYEEKDLESIQEMFADGIILRDWKIRVEGKEKALDETRKNFEAADSITIDVLATHESQDTVAAELKIVVDHTEVLYVVDIVQFDDGGKIAAIRAYLGRGDK